jgi:hypothetical protein
MKRTTTEVFHSHLYYRLQGDLDGDIKENYAPNVVIISSGGSYHGHQGAKDSARHLADSIGDSTFTYRHTIVEENYAFLEWTASSGDTKVCDGADSFIINNGKIIQQTIHYTPSKTT